MIAADVDGDAIVQAGDAGGGSRGTVAADPMAVGEVVEAWRHPQLAMESLPGSKPFRLHMSPHSLAYPAKARRLGESMFAPATKTQCCAVDARSRPDRWRAPHIAAHAFPSSGSPLYLLEGA